MKADNEVKPTRCRHAVWGWTPVRQKDRCDRKIRETGGRARPLGVARVKGATTLSVSNSGANGVIVGEWLARSALSPERR